MKRVLVVDDEEGVRSFIAEALAKKDLSVTTAADGEEAAALLEKRSFHLVITDLKMPRLDGMALLKKLRAEAPETEVIVLTAYGTVESAVAAMKLGALDYLTKPIGSPEELRLIVARALETRALRQERAVRRRVEVKGSDFVAEDPVMRARWEQLLRVAATEATVLIFGESGTGKEVAARAVHAHSSRKDGTFVAVNCAAITESLLESEIFGHEKGAFTGASELRRGRFELADGGTLFLDEVGELDRKLQAKLLRVLEQQSFERVGGTRTIDVDVRVIAATNRDLERDVQDGRFRLDLLHRLAVFPVRLPPLRERPRDILPLSKHLLAEIAAELLRPGLRLGERAAAKLLLAPWPGNVRELRNALERAAILADGDVIDEVGVSDLIENPEDSELDGTLREIEKRAIERALAKTGGHRKRAAEQLGIGLRTLYEKLEKLGL